ncbi:hypothetical protein ACTPEF_23680, partial [Clostridioides difficile]
KNKNDIRKYIFEAIPTTDIVSNPYDYLKKDIPTLLISFARSGNLNSNKEAVTVMSNQSLPKGNTNSKQTLSVSTIGSKTIVKND